MIRDIPKKYQKLYESGRNRSRKAAIRSFCIECIGYNIKEIESCTDKGCPLFKWRLTG